MAVTKYHEQELFTHSIAGGDAIECAIEVTGELVTHDTEVVCEEVSKITLQVWSRPGRKLNINADIDPTSGIGVPLAEFFAKELENVYADQWQDIAEAEAERCEAIYEDYQIERWKEKRHE